MDETGLLGSAVEPPTLVQFNQEKRGTSNSKFPKNEFDLGKSDIPPSRQDTGKWALAVRVRCC